jgi:hypothetical protein
MKKTAIIIITALVIWLSPDAIAQVAPQKYFVEFMDKTDSPFSIDRPQEFLSSRAIERRQKQGIPIDESDLPVNTNYINRVRVFTNSILTRSKWFNGITIHCLNPAMVDSISRLPFVKSVTKNIKRNEYINNEYSDNKFIKDEVILQVDFSDLAKKNSDYNRNMMFEYGPSYRQINMLNGDSLHRLGYRGQGKVIAILDAGFSNVDKLVAFDSLWSNNQILGTKDFVNPGGNVFNEYEHGMKVLSTIGGNIPGQLIGTAPQADFWLLRSVDVNNEYIREEYNWISAAEFADSAGADIINSSLGYITFFDTTQNHTCNDMNGNSTPITKGANMAFTKGMIVVSSAGNSGTSWKCVSAPADGFNVLAVAAVDSNGNRAGFSSVGEATHRIKPNVGALGELAVVSSTIGTIMYANGTSYSSPIIAGLVACLWQAAPTWSNESVKRSIELSGSIVMTPDSLIGYGIPDFVKALQVLSVGVSPGQDLVKVYPNPFQNVLTISLVSEKEQEFDISLCNQQGIVIFSLLKHRVTKGENSINLTNIPELQNGIYLLNISGSDFRLHTKVIKMKNEN